MRPELIRIATPAHPLDGACDTADGPSNGGWNFIMPAKSNSIKGDAC